MNLLILDLIQKVAILNDKSEPLVCVKAEEYEKQMADIKKLFEELTLQFKNES